jgi:hypothetical protein
MWGAYGLILAGIRLQKWELCMEVMEQMVVLLDLSKNILFFLCFYFKKRNHLP